MATYQKRTLREIAASATPALKQKVADLVLLDFVRKRKVNCAQVLRKAAVSLSLSQPDGPESELKSTHCSEAGSKLQVKLVFCQPPTVVSRTTPLILSVQSFFKDYSPRV